MADGSFGERDRMGGPQPNYCPIINKIHTYDLCRMFVFVRAPLLFSTSAAIKYSEPNKFSEIVSLITYNYTLYNYKL